MEGKGKDRVQVVKSKVGGFFRGGRWKAAGMVF